MADVPHIEENYEKIQQTLAQSEGQVPVNGVVGIAELVGFNNMCN
jgi:hypothetical protein